MPNDKTKLLYDAVSKDYDIGTYEEFDAKMQMPDKRKAFYDGVGKEYDLGDYATFESKISNPITPTQQSPFGIETSPTKIAENVVNPVKTFEFGQPQNIQKQQDLQNFQSQQVQQGLVNPQELNNPLGVGSYTKIVKTKPKELRLPTDKELQTFVDNRDLPNIKKVAQDYKDIDPAKSVIMYEKATEIEPDNAENHIQLAGQYAQLGDAQKALESANVAQAIETNTPLTDEQKRNRTVAVNNPYLYQIKSWAQQKLGDYDGSIESGKASLNIASQKPTGEYLYQQNEKDYTDAATTASLIKNAYNAKGDYENAQKYAQHAQTLYNTANAITMAKSEKAYNDYFKSDDFQKDFALFAVSPEINAIKGIYEGGRQMIEAGTKAGLQGEKVSSNAIKSFNGAVSAMFSAAMAVNPMVNYEFAAFGILGENYAPEIYQAIMKPVSAFIKDKSKLSETQKGVVDVFDTAGMLLLFHAFGKFNKGMQDGMSMKANSLLQQDLDLIKKVVTKQKLSDAEIKTVENTIQETPDAIVDKGVEMAKKLAEKKQELQKETEKDTQSGIKKTESTEIVPEFKDIQSTTKALVDINPSSSEYKVLTDLIPRKKFNRESSEEVIAEEYHKDKAKNKNTNLVREVESLINRKLTGKPTETIPEQVQGEKIDFSTGRAIFNIGGEEITINIKPEVIEASKEMDAIQRAKAESILRQQAHDEYNKKIEESVQSGEPTVEKPTETPINVKEFRKGDGGTRGVFIDNNGKLYKSAERTQIVKTENGFERQPISGSATPEYEILSELQGNKNVPKIGNVVETSNGKAFEIERLEEVDKLSIDDYRKIEHILDDLNEKGYHVDDKVTIMKRPSDGEFVVVDFSSGYKGKDAYRDSRDNMSDVRSKVGENDLRVIDREKLEQQYLEFPDIFEPTDNGYIYRMRMRPFSIGTHPENGFVKLVKEGNKREDGYHALIEYDRPLTDKEVKSFELQFDSRSETKYEMKGVENKQPAIAPEKEGVNKGVNEGVNEGVKSILNQDTDLKGGKKAQWQKVVSEEDLKAHRQGYGVNDIRSIENAIVKKDNIVGGKKVKASQFDMAISRGEMTANDAKTIIESAGLKVPKDILELAEKEGVTQVETVVTDAQERQKLQNAILEGEMILKSGKKNSGKKMSDGELEAVRKSVEKAKKELGINEPIAKNEQPIGKEIEKPSLSEIKSEVIEKADEAQVSARKEGVSLKTQKNDLLQQINKARVIVDEFIGDGSKNYVGADKDIADALKEKGFEIIKNRNGDHQVVFDVEGDGTFNLSVRGLEEAYKQVEKHWSTSEARKPNPTGIVNRMPKQGVIGDYSTMKRAKESLQDAIDNAEQAKKSKNADAIELTEKQLKIEKQQYDEVMSGFKQTEKFLQERIEKGDKDIKTVYDVDELLKIPETKNKLAAFRGEPLPNEKPNYSLALKKLNEIFNKKEAEYTEYEKQFLKQNGERKKSISTSVKSRLSANDAELRDIKEKINEVTEASKPEPTKTPLDETMSKYGWTTNKTEKGIELINSKNKVVALIKEGKDGKYTITDTGGTKLLSGNKDVVGGAEQVARDYFYAKEVKPTKELTPKEIAKKNLDYGDKVSFTWLGEKQRGEITTKRPNGNFDIKGDDGTNYPNIKPEVISIYKSHTEIAKEIADKIRKGKIDNDILMATIPFAKEVWNGAVETVAKTVEAGGKLADAVEKGIDYIKDTDWYKNLPFDKKQLAEQRLRDNFERTMSDVRNENKGIEVTKEEIKLALEEAEKNKKQIKNNLINKLKESKLVTIPKGVIGVFHPFFDKSSRQAATILRKNLGEMERRNVVADKGSNQRMLFWDKIDTATKVWFITNLERGIKFSDPKLQELAKEYRDRMDAVHDIINTIKDVPYIEDYFPHFWKNRIAADKFFKDHFSKNPLEGRKQFTKERFYQDILAGIKNGLELKTYNPEEIARIAEMNAFKFKMANDFFNDLKDIDLVRFIRDKNEIPDGWKLVDDPLFKRMTVFETKSGEPAVSFAGYYVPEGAAEIIKRYTSRGIKGNIPDALRQFNNTMNRFQLGLSAFHGLTTTLDSTFTGWGIAFDKLSRGKISGFTDLFNSLTIVPNLIKTLKIGGKTIKDYKNGIINDRVEKLVTANGRSGVDAVYKSEMWFNFRRNLIKHEYGQALLRFAPALIDGMAKPLFEKYVPRLKVGTFLKTAENELSKLKDPTQEQIDRTIQKSWDSTEDRLGQMTYDNIFWDKITKDIGFLTVRSLGWNLGTARAFGKGAGNIPKSVVSFVRGKGIDPNTAWLVGLVAGTATYGAIYNYLATGESPKDWKDYFYPRDGGVNADGTPSRIQFPTYMKEFFNVKRHGITQTLSSKFSPLLNQIIENFNNKDFYGEQIHNPDDPFYKQGVDILKYFGEQTLPFTFRTRPGEEQSIKDQFSTIKGIEKKLGLMPAPRDIERKDWQNIIIKEAGKNSNDKPMTQYEADRKVYLRKLKDMIYGGSDYSDELNTAINKGYIAESYKKAFVEDAKQNPYYIMFRNLSPEAQLKTYGEIKDNNVREDLKKFIKSQDAFDRLELQKPELKDEIKNMPIRTESTSKPKKGINKGNIKSKISGGIKSKISNKLKSNL